MPHLPLRVPRHRRGSTAAIGALVLLVTLAACGSESEAVDGTPDTPGAPAGGDARVLVMGDSLTVGADLWGDLTGQLAAGGWDAEVVAEDGRAVDWAIARVRERTTVPATVVVGLGTNPGPSPDTFPHDVATLVDELVSRGATTVVWVPPGDVATVDRVRRADAVRAAAGGPLVVPDWPAELAAHDGWVGPDGVHLTHDGYRELAAFVARQLVRPAG